MALPDLLPIEVLHCGKGNFTHFAPVTLTLTWWPSYTNLNRIPWRCTCKPKMVFLYVPRLSEVIVLQKDRHTYYRQTDATENIITPLTGWW